MPKRKTPYRSKVKIGVGPDGKPINKWIQGSTRAELDEQRRRVIAYYITGEGLEKDRLFGEYAVEWYHVRKAPFVSEATRNAYRSTLNRRILPEFGERYLRAIKPMDLQRYMNGLKGMSVSRITLSLIVLKQIFRAALQDRLVEYDPTVGLIRPEATPPEHKRALTSEERARMAEIFPTHPHGLYLAVMYYTGMRPGEARGLQWGDFDWERNLVHVQRDVDYATHKPQLGAVKTKSSDRHIPIASELRDLLYPHRQAPAALLFPGTDGGPMSLNYSQKIWIDLMIACDMADPIPGAKGTSLLRTWTPRITPHTMRHNFVTMCWESGMDIVLTMRMVGHANFSTTRDIYTHLSEAHLDAAQTSLDAMFGGKVASKLHDEKVRKRSRSRKNQ